MNRPRRASLFGLVVAHLRRLNADEEGASMIFAAMTFLALTFSVMFVYQIGMVSTDRILMQNAADAGAYSGALVEANSLNTIAQLNDGMAYLHYNILRYVVDSIVIETLRTYERHDRYVRQRPLMERFWTEGQGDPSIVLSLADPQGLKPDDSYGLQAENRPAPPWVMLGDPQEWTARTRHVARFRQLIDDGKLWLQDLQSVQRLIVAVTPRLVRDTAVGVACNNGATHVAVSGDLERAFTISPQPGGTNPDYGFEPMKAAGGNGLANQTWQRYALRKMEELDDRGQRVHREFPAWFDATNGRSQPAGPGFPHSGNYEGYFQIRLCWNKNDWAHRDRPESHAPPLYAAAPPVQQSEAPNGHWHCRHAHLISTPAGPQVVSHGGVSMGRELMTMSGLTGGGHPQDDPELHGLATDPSGANTQHHAFVRCPTCAGAAPAQPGSRWTDVRKSIADAGDQPGTKLVIDQQFPRPLLPRGPLMRSGVTVVAWREGHGVGEVFPKSPWGMLAVATAQVGLLDGQGRVRLLTQLAQDNRGATYQGSTIPLADPLHPAAFFYSSAASDPNQSYGMRFGARLVPVAGHVERPGMTGEPLSPWHPSLADSGLDAMLGPSRKRWVDASKRGVAGPPVDPPGTDDGWELTHWDPASDGGDNWTRLSRFFRVKSQAEMRGAMWH